LVINSACKDGEITEYKFWQAVKNLALLRSEEIAGQQERRRWDIERVRFSCILPNGDDLGKIQSYESFLSREFYKALHELQGIQSARLEQGIFSPISD
jgi:hypothetical protein